MAQLYAIVGDMERARFMLEGGVPYLQLRFKERPLAPHQEEVANWAAEYPTTRVIVNDDLKFAESAGAWGVHLGQEDLGHYAIGRLRATSLVLGISTHSEAEISRAMAESADMIGFGPIFATATKQVGHPPQGTARLRAVVAASPVPVVAIGGIGEKNIDDVVAAGAHMVAMIGGLDRISTAEQLRALMSRLRGNLGRSA